MGHMNGLRITGFGLAAFLAGCAANDPETEIRALLTDAEQAAEARDTGFFADLIAAAYQDAHGNDRQQVINLVRGYFIANQRVEIVSRIEDIELEGADAARAVVYAGMVGQRSGADLLGGLRGDMYRFELELVNDDGDWQIIGARWDRALGE